MAASSLTTRDLVPFMQLAEKQGTSANSRFLEACRKTNAGELTQSQLVEQTVRLGFNNVIDAFHVVGQDEVPLRFFHDQRRDGEGIRVTAKFSELLCGRQGANLPLETEARLAACR